MTHGISQAVFEEKLRQIMSRAYTRARHELGGEEKTQISAEIMVGPDGHGGITMTVYHKVGIQERSDRHELKVNWLADGDTWDEALRKVKHGGR